MGPRAIGRQAREPPRDPPWTPRIGRSGLPQGRTAEARAAWTEGLRPFPNDASLLEPLRAFD